MAGTGPPQRRPPRVGATENLPYVPGPAKRHRLLFGADAQSPFATKWVPGSDGGTFYFQMGSAWTRP